MQPHAAAELAAPSVVSVREFRMALVEHAMQNTKFIKVALSTIEEARCRAIVLALLTCNVRKGSSSFVRFHTERDF